VQSARGKQFPAGGRVWRGAHQSDLRHGQRRANLQFEQGQRLGELLQQPGNFVYGSGIFDQPADRDAAKQVFTDGATSFTQLQYYAERRASADQPVYGAVTPSISSCQNTFSSDNLYETITEIQRGTKRLLDHRWPMVVPAGATKTFNLEAHCLDPSSEIRSISPTRPTP